MKKMVLLMLLTMSSLSFAATNTTCRVSGLADQDLTYKFTPDMGWNHYVSGTYGSVEFYNLDMVFREEMNYITITLNYSKPSASIFSNEAKFQMDFTKNLRLEGIKIGDKSVSISCYGSEVK